MQAAGRPAKIGAEIACNQTIGAICLPNGVSGREPGDEQAAVCKLGSRLGFAKLAGLAGGDDLSFGRRLFSYNG